MSTTKLLGVIMQVLVTGATGFVGSHLVETLVKRGHKVRVLVRTTSDVHWIRGLPLIWCLGDIKDPTSLSNALQGVEWVFHVAGVTKAIGYSAYESANVKGTQNVLEACLQQQRPPQKVVVVSSLGAAGPCDPNYPRLESDVCQPVSHYGLSKMEAERIALSYRERMSMVVIRPPTTYGPRDRDILALFRLVKSGFHLTLGQGEHYLCMIHVADLVEAVLQAAETAVSSGSIFFVSDGETHTWSEIVSILEGLLGVRTRKVRIPVGLALLIALGWETVCRVRRIPPLLNRQKVMEIQQVGWTCDIQEAAKKLHFTPTISLQEGLKETYRWYLDQGWI